MRGKHSVRADFLMANLVAAGWKSQLDTHTHTCTTWTFTHIYRSLKRGLWIWRWSAASSIPAQREAASAPTTHCLICAARTFQIKTPLSQSLTVRCVNRITQRKPAEANEKDFSVPTCHACSSPSIKQCVCQSASWTLQEQSGLRCARMLLLIYELFY